MAIEDKTTGCTLNWYVENTELITNVHLHQGWFAQVVSKHILFSFLTNFSISNSAVTMIHKGIGEKH